MLGDRGREQHTDHMSRPVVVLAWVLAAVVSLLTFLRVFGAGAVELAEWAVLFAAAIGLYRFFKMEL
jgi:hypothetical protein